MPVAKQFHLFDPSNRYIFHLKKFHNVNFRVDDEEKETVCVIGDSTNVYNFITALVTSQEDSRENQVQKKDSKSEVYFGNVNETTHTITSSKEDSVLFIYISRV